jgi:predicted kinase
VLPVHNLYIPIGPPAAGKTTWAHTLLNGGLLDDETAIVSPDHYRQVLTGDMTNQNVNSSVFRIVDMILEHRFEHGQDVFLDATNLTLRDLRRVLAMCEYASGYQIWLHRFDVPEAELRRRNANRDRVVPDHVMDRMIQRYNTLDVEAISDEFGTNLITINPFMEEL